MGFGPSLFRLEELYSNLYEVEKIEKVNYQQYVPKNKDDQWTIKMELLIRKDNPKSLVTLLSKELWRFSINDDPIPPLPYLEDVDQEAATGADALLVSPVRISDDELHTLHTHERTEIKPDKVGEFGVDYSKPNLPPHYALFLKSLRRALYLNLALQAENRIVQFSNACISLKPHDNVRNPLIQIEPHLFASGSLVLSVCTKDLGLMPLTEDLLNDEFLRSHALYIAPAGLRVHLVQPDKKSYFTPPPENAEKLLATLKIAHGVDLGNAPDLKWVILVPNIAYSNDFIPSIASYLSTPANKETVSWPLQLCFAQPSGEALLNRPTKIQGTDSGTNKITENISFGNFQTAMDMIDDFIQIKQTAAYRTPGSSGISGTNATGNSGGYTDQLQHYNRISTSTRNTTQNPSPVGRNTYDISARNSITGVPRASIAGLVGKSGSNSTVNEFSLLDKIANLSPNLSTSPTVSNCSNQLFNDRKSISNRTPSTNDPNIPLNIPSTGVESNASEKELFGDEDDEVLADANDIVETKQNLRGEHVSMKDACTSAFNQDVKIEEENGGSGTNIPEQQTISSIPDSVASSTQNPKAEGVENSSETGEDEDLFGDKSDTSIEDKRLGAKRGSDEITEDMFGMSDDDDKNKSSDSFNNNNDDKTEGDGPSSKKDFNSESPSRRKNLKRKYLDIPIDEMTLSKSPFYTDPGAPLPIETPRDRRKSVFAPLNFNPIIENNVDNKYKNGGKFSFTPTQKEEALQFDVSTAELSSSEEEESDSSFEAFAYSDIGQDWKGHEFNYRDPNIPTYQSSQLLRDPIPQGLMSGNFNSNTSDLYYGNRGDVSDSIWKLPQGEILPAESPTKPLELSIPSSLSATNLADGLSKENDVPSPQNGGDSEPVFEDVTIKKENRENGGNQLVNAGSETLTTTNTNQKTSVNNLPFLLRQLPLSSIPDVYFISTPTITISNDDYDALNLICEQIVYDYGLLKNLNVPECVFEAVSVEPERLVGKAVRNLFSRLRQVCGNEIVADIYPIEQPFVTVRKNHDMINVKSDSQGFSKFLNFKPPFGMKNFKLLMITDSFKNDCNIFVSTLMQTYIGQEFGFCELLKLDNGDTDGLLLLPSFQHSKLLLLAAQIVSYCSTNKHLNDNVTLMIIIPLLSNDISELVEKTKLFQIVRNEVRDKIPNLDIFFKAIPMDFIRNPLTSIDEYYNLCASMYNILPDREIKLTSIAHKLPEKVVFRNLQTGGGTGAIQYDSFVHLAYARSVDKKWVFAVLSSSDGKSNIVKTWYVGGSKRLFDDACTRLWELGSSLAGKQYGKICLVLTRLNGTLPDDELMNWRRLSGRNVHLAVVCVDDHTKISFFDRNKIYPTFRPIFRDESLSKKIQEYRFDDYEIRDTDQDIHGVIFQHAFPLSNSQHRCAIKSGALIRFKRNAGDSIWDKFEVNLLNCPHSDSTELLGAILTEFRNLSALNSWFGLTVGEDSYLPWHVLAVKKMMRTVVHVNVELAE